MSLVYLNSVEKSFGAQRVLAPATMQVNAGEGIGLVGRNGAGKTTLLKLIAGLEHPSGGHVRRAPGVRIAYLPQNPTFPPGRTLRAEVREGIAALDRLEEQLRDLEVRLADPALREDEAEARRLLDRYAHLQDRFDARDGWRADARVEAVLDGLKVPRADWNRDISTFSGGQLNIIGLARVLVQEPDLMLLDEPGNHLDFEGLAWLEEELRSARCAFLLVSHSRYLLDGVCGSTWELEEGRVERYAGNYSAYRAEKLTRLQRAEAEHRQRRREMGRLNFQIQRLKSWAQVYDNPKLARTAKRFEKRVEKMREEDAGRPRENKRAISLALGSEATRGDIALDVKGYTRAYGDAPPLLRDVSFRLRQGERVALVGANGTGKTTLLRDVVREGRWEHPVLRVGAAMRVGYLSQTGEDLRPETALLAELMRLGGITRREAERLLYRFLFQRDDFTKTVGVLSGGERTRLQLAALMARGANFLLLDEPTNHLDIPSREVVEEALEGFAGTLLIVSHDRYFLDKIAGRVLYIRPPQIHVYEGNFSDFWRAREEERAVEARRAAAAAEEERERAGSAAAGAGGGAGGRRGVERGKGPVARGGKGSKKQGGKGGKRRVKWDPERFAGLEREIARLEERCGVLRGEIAREEARGKEKRAADKRRRLTAAEEKLAAAWEEWLALGERRKSLP